jgi:hypothetical protein
MEKFIRHKKYPGEVGRRLISLQRRKRCHSSGSRIA